MAISLLPGRYSPWPKRRIYVWLGCRRLYYRRRRFFQLPTPPGPSGRTSATNPANPDSRARRNVVGGDSESGMESMNASDLAAGGELS